jgi:hypothetical protein
VVRGFILDLGTLAVCEDRTRSAISIPDFEYRVEAEVTFLSEKVCVIDFGLRATAALEQAPVACKTGDYVSGEVKLSLPLCTDIVPDEVFETLAHRWKVNRISADLTQYIAHPDNPRFFTRDDSQIHYQDVPPTRSVMARDYILHCTEVLPGGTERLFQLLKSDATAGFDRK